MTYADIAGAIGLTKGRITQIRASAPPQERALFGVGPVTIGVPARYGTTDRERPLLAAEDVAAADSAAQLLTDLGFATSLHQIEPDDTTLPNGDLFIICGPKSAPVATQLIDQDPVLNIVSSDSSWSIIERATGAAFESPADLYGEHADVAYLSRRSENDRVVTHIAGLHAIGSLGAVRYLHDSTDAIYSATREASFSLVIGSRYDGLQIIETRVHYGPQRWSQ